ncbi:MAG: nucleotidyltransferase family protein [Methylovulum sp.]|nr:nucleotidyltransferase family protein [Methylovulum sp.]
MKTPKNLGLGVVFNNPNAVLELTLPQWSVLISQARAAGMLARLGLLLQEAGLLAKIPPQPLVHIQSALTFSQRFDLSLQWELQCIETALADVNIPIIYLKGSAYSVAGDRAASGRLFSDVDILVPEDKLLAVETALVHAGWMSQTFDPYDQTYYRQWMHEIPPMRHLQRHTSIDVHHNILPKTCQYSPDARQLLAHIVKVPGKDCWVLASEDRLLHSAAHLFYGGEFERGFRDLSDIDLLLKEFSAQEGFWDKLLQHAATLKLDYALYYALRYTHLMFKTPIPEAIFVAAAQNISLGKPMAKCLDALFLNALQPHHSSCHNRWTQLALLLLFIRSHWLKMPFHLLAVHLFTKGLRRIKGEDNH